MHAREAVQLTLRVALLSGAAGLGVLAVDALVGGGGLLGIAVVLVGGVVAVGSLVNPQPTGPGGLEAAAAPLVTTLDPLAHAGAPSSPPVRRFLYGTGLLVVGAAAVVVLG